MTSLFERLNDNEIILLDGGVSTEIQKRGVAMDSDVWSGLAHKTHPQVVLQVHEDYIQAGASDHSKYLFHSETRAGKY